MLQNTLQYGISGIEALSAEDIGIVELLCLRKVHQNAWQANAAQMLLLYFDMGCPFVWIWPLGFSFCRALSCEVAGLPHITEQRLANFLTEKIGKALMENSQYLKSATKLRPLPPFCLPLLVSWRLKWCNITISASIRQSSEVAFFASSSLRIKLSLLIGVAHCSHSAGNVLGLRLRCLRKWIDANSTHQQ